MKEQAIYTVLSVLAGVCVEKWSAIAHGILHLRQGDLNDNSFGCAPHGVYGPPSAHV